MKLHDMGGLNTCLLQKLIHHKKQTIKWIEAMSKVKNKHPKYPNQLIQNQT